MKLFIAILCAFAGLAVLPAHAAIYHCVDDEGRKLLRDSPCDGTVIAKAPEAAAAPAFVAKPRTAAPKVKAMVAPKANAASAAQ